YILVSLLSSPFAFLFILGTMLSEVDSENLLSGEGYDDAGSASPSVDVNIMDSDRPGNSDHFEPSYVDAVFELRARMRNQVRADIRRDLNLLSSPKLAPAVDVPPIALDYTFRSWTQFMDSAGSGKGQYGTNLGNIVVSFDQGAVRGAHLEGVAGSSRPTDGDEVSSRAADDTETAISEEEEEDEEIGDSILESEDDLPELWSDGEDVTTLCEQVVREQNLDEDPDSDLEDEKYRRECRPPTGSKVETTKISSVWRKRVVKDDHPRWAKEFFKFPSGYRLKYQKKSGWWSFYTRAGKMTVYPKLSSCHGWEKKFYWLRVPSEFPLRTRFSLPRPHMEHYPDRELGFREKRAYRFVSCNRVDTGLQKTVCVPKYWLPPAKYILANGPLSVVGLCHTHPLGLHTLDFPKLGLAKDGRPTTNTPANPRGVFSTISTYSTTANRKCSLSREEPTTESPAKKTRALNSIPAPKPISIRDPSSRSADGWGVREPPRQPFSGVQPAVGTSEMAGGLQSLDCGRGASQAARRDRNRAGPYNRPTTSRRHISREQASVAAQKVSDIPVEQNAGVGDTPSEVPFVQNDVAVVDIRDSPSHHEDQEVNNTDAGILDNTLIPPPTNVVQSAYVRPSQSAGTSSLHMGLFVRPEEWIETTPVLLTPNKKKCFEVPPGNPDEPWDPKIDLLRGESILTDDCRFGGCMGWRALKGLATPRDTPAVKIDAPAAQHMNDMYKAVTSGVELVKLYVCYQKENAALKQAQADWIKEKKQSEDDYAKVVTELENVKRRNLEQENVSVELDAEKKKTEDLTVQLGDVDAKMKEAYRKGAKDGALRFSRSKTYCKRVTDSHNGGWFAAHRCKCSWHWRF
ncbi:hypothetical protein SOVF_130280, partial [Spinacia oleracea]